MDAQSIMSKTRTIWQGDGPDYERLGRFDEGEKGHASSKRSIRHVKPVVIVSACLLAIYLFLLPAHGTTKVAAPIKEALPPAYLRLVLPVTKADANFCKTMLSAAILNYPEPVFVGFQGKQGRVESPEDDLHQVISRTSNILDIDDHLRNISTSRDEDLVIIADGINTWFQLRPQILLDRYFESNRRADERIKKTFGQAADTLKLRQTIIFSSQKGCSHWDQDDPACTAVPGSTLPKNLYGPETDFVVDGQIDISKTRPRYLNANFAMGPLKDMRRLYAEAARRTLGDSSLRTPEKVLGRIFGEQEALRNAQMTAASGLGLSGWFETASAKAEKQAQLLKQTDLSKEFGIGLDYESNMAYQTLNAEGDISWLRFNDPEQKKASNAAHRVIKDHISELQPDIATSLPPFWTFSEEQLPRNSSWMNVSLLTNVWTGVTPALIQHDSSHGTGNMLRQSWWTNLWYQRYARKLYDVHIQAPLGALAVSGYDAESRRQWWCPEDWKGGGRNTTKFWWRYEDVCTGTENEVFRDKKGPWVLPANH